MRLKILWVCALFISSSNYAAWCKVITVINKCNHYTLTTQFWQNDLLLGSAKISPGQEKNIFIKNRYSPDCNPASIAFRFISKPQSRGGMGNIYFNAQGTISGGDNQTPPLGIGEIITGYAVPKTLTFITCRE